MKLAGSRDRVRACDTGASCRSALCPHCLLGCHDFAARAVVVSSALVDCCPPTSSPLKSSPGSKPATRRGAIAGAIAIALLPKCPACWSAYAGLSSLLGLSFVLERPYLLPLTAAALSLAVGSVALSARGRGHGPWLLGTLMGAGVLIGKFAMESQVLTHMSLIGLVCAASWSGWRGRRLPSARLRTAP